ncbi:MAG: hypothetical protein ACOYMN_16490 [Roseimicrobium sp.]
MNTHRLLTSRLALLSLTLFCRRPLPPNVRAILLLSAGLLCSSCMNPNQPNAGYFAMDPNVAAQNRAYTHAIEDDSQQFRHRERMSVATATELATRNAPRVIYHTSIHAPHCCWR